MPLTPDEIADKEFTFGLRGYDQEEVRTFLRLVALQCQTAAAEAQSGSGPELSPSEATLEATKLLERAHAEAEEIRQSAGAEAEMVRARARAVLSAAQDVALRLVAETHGRIDRRTGTGGESNEGNTPPSTVEQLGEEISAMVQARDDVLHQLQELKTRLDLTVEAAEADPLLRRDTALRT